MAFSLSFKCYPWSLPLTLNHLPPSLSTIDDFRPFPVSNPHQHLKLSSSTNPFVLSPSPLQDLPPDFTSKQLLDTLRRQNDESSALRVFEWASKQPNFAPSSSIYEEILRKLGKVGSFESMRNLVHEMNRAGCSIGKAIFLIFIDSYAEFELYDEILGCLQVMENEFGVKPDTHFYNYALNVLVEGNKLKLVETAHLHMSSRGIKADVSTFNVLIKSLCRAHQIRPAILMMEEMSSYGLSPDEKTFTTIMLGGALRIKEQMVEYGCSSTNVTVSVLINGFCPDQFTFKTLVKINHGALDLSRNFTPKEEKERKRFEDEKVQKTTVSSCETPWSYSNGKHIIT